MEMQNPYRADLLAVKHALVTGASRGIGRQCARSLAACGAEVVALARDEADLGTLREEAGSLLHPCPADANAADYVHTVQSLGVFDVLVNSLGTNQPQPFTEVTDEALETMLHLNLVVLFKTTQQVARAMLENKIPGSIINVSSQMGRIGAPNRTVYCATKHAVEGLTKALAVELAPQGIRVNAVAPTFIETPMTAPMWADAAFRQSVLERIPLGKIGTVDDVAWAVVYLASEAAEMVTGASLSVDGGWTAQ